MEKFSMLIDKITLPIISFSFYLLCNEKEKEYFCNNLVSILQEETAPFSVNTVRLNFLKLW
jgi:hypothetical protein